MGGHESDEWVQSVARLSVATEQGRTYPFNQGPEVCARSVPESL